MSENEEVKAAETTETAETAKEIPEELKRKVVISRNVKVSFTRKSGKDSGEAENVVANRDVFSVMEAITERLSKTTSKEDMADILVSVYSLEDPEQSDPLPEGDTRWEGPYGVGGAIVENLSIPEAMQELSKAMLSADVCLSSTESLVEQFFQRSRMDSMVFIGVFDGVPAVLPLITSFRDVSPESFGTLYRQMHIQAENLRKFIEKRFPEKHVDWTGKEKHDRENPVKADTTGIVLPSGAPAEPSERKFQSAADIMDNSTRIVHLS